MLAHGSEESASRDACPLEVEANLAPRANMQSVPEMNHQEGMTPASGRGARDLIRSATLLLLSHAQHDGRENS
jgi:hypothetical protein